MAGQCSLSWFTWKLLKFSFPILDLLFVSHWNVFYPTEDVRDSFPWVASAICREVLKSLLPSSLSFSWGCPEALYGGVRDSQDPYQSGVGEVTRCGTVPRGQPSTFKEMNASMRSHGSILQTTHSAQNNSIKGYQDVTSSCSVFLCPPYLFSPLCPSLTYSFSFLSADIKNGWNPGIILSIVNLTESSGRGASEHASRGIYQLC